MRPGVTPASSKLAPVGLRQVDVRPSLLPELCSHLRSHLVAALADARTDGGVQVRRHGAEPRAHRFHGALPRCAPPCRAIRRAPRRPRGGARPPAGWECSRPSSPPPPRPGVSSSSASPSPEHAGSARRPRRTRRSESASGWPDWRRARERRRGGCRSRAPATAAHRVPGRGRPAANPW